jgi:hypothetical protein
MAGRSSFGKMLSTADYKGGKGTQILSYGVYTYLQCGSYMPPRPLCHGGERGRLLFNLRSTQEKGCNGEAGLFFCEVSPYLSTKQIFIGKKEPNFFSEFFFGFIGMCVF